MERSTPLSNSQTQGHTSKAGSTQQKTRRIRTGIAITLWFIGLILLASASVLIRNHPGPWPFEVTFSQTVQNLHYWPWIPPLLVFIGTFNNPTPTGIMIGILFVGMILLGWYRQAIFFALVVGIGNFLDTLIGDYVVRPRPSPTESFDAFLRLPLVLEFHQTCARVAIPLGTNPLTGFCRAQYFAHGLLAYLRG